MCLSQDMIWVEDSSEVVASYLPVCVSALAWCAHCLREYTGAYIKPLHDLCLVTHSLTRRQLGSVFWAFKTVATYCAVIGILFPDDWCDVVWWPLLVIKHFYDLTYRDMKMFLTVGQLVSRPCSQLEFAESGRKENVREAWIMVTRTKNLCFPNYIRKHALVTHSVTKTFLVSWAWVCRAWKELLWATWIGRWRRSLPLKQVGLVWSVQVTFVSVGESD